MNRAKKEISFYLDRISLFIVGGLLLLFPILFLATTTDAFVLPKQILLTASVAILSIFLAVKTISEGKLKMRTSPFDLPVMAFVAVAFLSAVLSRNQVDSLIAFIPLFFVAILYFVIVNLVKKENELLFVISMMAGGAVLSSLITISSFFSVYLLPFEYTKIQFFTTFGSLLDQAIYLALLLPMVGYFVFAAYSKKNIGSSHIGSTHPHPVQKTSKSLVGFTASFAIITISLIITVYFLTTTQRPLILPYETGLQIGFASISQDTNVFKSMLLGSGIGTFLTDFTRFKPASYNLNPDLWSFVFFRSSSWALEILATMGILGISTFFWIIWRIFKAGTLFLPIALLVIAALFLPFSFTLVTLFFILLAIFAVVLIHGNPDKYSENEFYLVTFKHGLLAVRPEGERVNLNENERRYSRILPIVYFVIVLLFVGMPLYFTTQFVRSDLTFQRSLQAAAQNNGLETYNLQTAAIQLFQTRDIYHRSFSQTNLAIANSLASNQREQDASPSAELQQQITTLIQQAINEARAAVTISPMTAFNWNNLSSIYRSLIGFGENADQFTVITAQQAIALDPNNPQQYLELGGIYFQLQLFDEAIRQFQIAISLKSDYANAYYNLGHALEAKGDLENALAVYQTVKNLVTEDEGNTKLISDEIEALRKRIESGEETPTASESAQSESELQVNDEAENALPERDPELEIPGPNDTPTPTPRQSTRPSPSN